MYTGRDLRHLVSYKVLIDTQGMTCLPSPVNIIVPNVPPLPAPSYPSFLSSPLSYVAAELGETSDQLPGAEKDTRLRIQGGQYPEDASESHR